MPDLSEQIFTDEAEARKFLETVRWPDGPVCPFCHKGNGVKALRGKSLGDGWYHCRFCRKKFTVRVGTLYQRSHLPLHKWLAATRLICSSRDTRITANMLRRVIGVSYRTAWSVKHRIERARDANA